MEAKLLMILLSFILTLCVAEIIARLLWPTSWGVPAFAVPDPQRFYVLAKNYEGWWSGQPVKTNNFAMRDDRDYKIEKDENTFRILVLGDSVTFGNNVRFEETWTYQFENMLKSWEPSVDWQVWNAGVPGYDAVTVLRTLKSIGPIYNPNMVIFGVYENDIQSRLFSYRENAKATWMYKFRSFLVKNSYFYHQVKRIFNVGTNRNLNSFLDKFIFSAIGDRIREQALLKPSETKIIDVSKFELKHNTENRKMPPEPELEYDPLVSAVFYHYEEVPNMSIDRLDSFKRAIKELQALHSAGIWEILFFLNIAPDISPDGKEFVNGVHNSVNKYFMDILNNDESPVISSYDAIWSYSPLEVPEAGGHSLAAANKVKASLLLSYFVEKFEDSLGCLKGNILCNE